MICPKISRFKGLIHCENPYKNITLQNNIATNLHRSKMKIFENQPLNVLKMRIKKNKRLRLARTAKFSM